MIYIIIILIIIIYYYIINIINIINTVPLDILKQYDASLYTQDHKAYYHFFAELVANAAHHGGLL